VAATLTEKIFARTAGLPFVSAGQAVTVRPDHALAYDFPGYSDKLIGTLEGFVATQAAQPGHRVMFIDHLTTRSSPRIDAIHAQTRQGAQRFGFDLHEGRGIGHQVACELGLARPGAMMVHFDPHVAAAGAYGALALGVGNSYVGIWATGKWHTRVPRSIELVLTGRLALGVDSRDLLHELVRRLAGTRMAGAVLEISGDGAAALDRDQMQGLCAMAIFTGALSAVYVDPDATVRPDADANYAERLGIDLDKVEPLLVLPGSARPDHIHPVVSQQGVAVTRAFVGSCVSGRLQDLRSVAAVVAGRHIAPGVRFILTPASVAIRLAADEEGLTARLRQAGVEVLDSSCDCCYGFAEPLAAGDTCISSGTLNITGRMGSEQSRIFLASPATVAAAAVTGHIADPRPLLTGAAA
jgi:3-isopropylmalate/(R)-2-methylmalate dehydratase large subunit